MSDPTTYQMNPQPATGSASAIPAGTIDSPAGPLCWEVVPNPNAMLIHVRHRFPSVGDELHQLEGRFRDMATSIRAIHGVTWLSVGGYSIVVCKGQLFSWDELREPINRTIWMLGLPKADGVPDPFSEEPISPTLPAGFVDQDFDGMS